MTNDSLKWSDKDIRVKGFELWKSQAKKCSIPKVMEKLCSEPNHTKLVLLTWRIPHLYLYSYFHLDPFAFVFMFVCLNYFLLSPEPIEAIFRPIHRKNRRPRVSLRYPPVSLKNNHLEYKHNYNHLEYKHNNAMNTNRTRMQLQMNIRWWEMI